MSCIQEITQKLGTELNKEELDNWKKTMEDKICPYRFYCINLDKKNCNVFDWRKCNYKKMEKLKKNGNNKI